MQLLCHWLTSKNHWHHRYSEKLQAISVWISSLVSNGRDWSKQYIQGGRASCHSDAQLLSSLACVHISHVQQQKHNSNMRTEEVIEGETFYSVGLKAQPRDLPDNRWRSETGPEQERSVHASSGIAELGIGGWSIRRLHEMHPGTGCASSFK